MIFAHAFRKDFPLTTVFLRSRLPSTPHWASIWPAFKKWGQLSEQEALDAITEGNPPTINCGEFPNGSYGDHWGDSDPSQKDYIYLNSQYLRYFEFSYANRSDLLFQRFLHAVTLHEMVHWGDNRDGVDQAPEEGNEFEKEVWGARVGDWDYWRTNAEATLHSRYPRATL